MSVVLCLGSDAALTTVITGASQIVTMAGPTKRRGTALNDIGIIKNGALAFRDGRILAVGSYEEVMGAAGPDPEEIELAGAVITPGLIDAHTHPVFGGNRANEFAMRAEGKTYQEIAAVGGGIRSTVAATRETSRSELGSLTGVNLIYMLRSGTTIAEAKSGYGLNLETELKILDVIEGYGHHFIPTFLGLHAVPTEFEGNKAGYVDYVINEMLPAAASKVRYVDAFIEQNYFSHEDATRLVHEARKFGLKARLHVDQLTDGGGAALAAELGCLSADHLEQTGEAGIKALAAADTWPVLLPASVFGLGLTKYPDARAMISAGLPVVLATDFNPGSSPTTSLPFVMSLACTQMKMTPAEALTACTIHAAGSLEIDSECGSLEPGKRANFVVYQAEDYREIPYWMGMETVYQTWINGKLASARSGYRTRKLASTDGDCL